MEERPASRERRGPQVYLHVEFGLSWNSKQPPKNHEVTYRSRGMRERSPAFPRQVAAPNTNYLAAIHDFEQRQTNHRPAAPPPARHTHIGPYHQMQEYYQVGHSMPHQRAREPPAPEQERPSRADSTSSRERGRSAPPPVGDNPWDVSVQQSQGGGRPSGVSAAVATQGAPDPWKALPAPPSKFRLGEDGMPWSSWSWPMGYDPDAYPRDEEVNTSTHSLPATATVSPEHTSPFEASPLSVSVYSPGGSRAPGRDVETGRARELGALSAAMMTVDNGFENQWWNQGAREMVPSEEVAAAAPSMAATLFNRNRFSARSLGWAVAETPAARTPAQPSALTSAVDNSSPCFHVVDMISPLTEAATLASPPPTYQSFHGLQPLQRSMSTRSEELWFTETGSPRGSYI
ncbi:hypothetical protein B0H66DRAFT_607170 [Apodospora peruviana]|uniref:Uncharacterized protein n=1 Tax=Apodospora peruviana TaxID=516989 RepID=A0AAE0HW17_9PEZI|nr:hypothetical protein B0H66DRAFT_607170 [Apodospora peruviana]